MYIFFFNSQLYIINQKINLLELLIYFNYNLSMLVVEYNNFICHRKHWKNIFITSNDKVEIITIVGGG